MTHREMDKLYPHHVGHWMGMDVHDSEGVSRSRKLRKGMVVTIGWYFRLFGLGGLVTAQDSELIYSSPTRFEFRTRSLRPRLARIPPTVPEHGHPHRRRRAGRHARQLCVELVGTQGSR